MRWLASLSPSRAFAIAALWPATLIIIPLVALRIWTFWMSRNTLVHAEFRAESGAWPTLLLVLFVPPVVFLVAWMRARR